MALVNESKLLANILIIPNPLALQRIKNYCIHGALGRFKKFNVLVSFI